MTRKQWIVVTALIAIVMWCASAPASITYDVSISTASLPPGNYQAAFFLIDPAAPENFSQAKLPDGFQIDGDVQTDYTHFWADQPTFNPVPSPIPINFYLTLQGAPGSSDYFFMAIRTPDGPKSSKRFNRRGRGGTRRSSLQSLVSGF